MAKGEGRSGIGVNSFYERMKLVGEYIPYGKVATYGQVALLCQKPQNARQVGYALRTGRAGELFPAHRVVSGSGYLSGAGAFAAPGQQKEMLAKEGIEVSEELRVDLKKYGWQNSFEDALLLQDLFAGRGI